MAACDDAVMCCEHCERLDEAQLELSKSLVKFKKFSSEEEALEFRNNQKEEWSEVLHKGDNYLVGYSRPMELIGVAIGQVNKEYNLQIPLTASYCLGKNWADCH